MKILNTVKTVLGKLSREKSVSVETLLDHTAGDPAADLYNLYKMGSRLRSYSGMKSPENPAAVGPLCV